MQAHDSGLLLHVVSECVLSLSRRCCFRDLAQGEKCDCTVVFMVSVCTHPAITDITAATVTDWRHG